MEEKKENPITQSFEPAKPAPLNIGLKSSSDEDSNLYDDGDDERSDRQKSRQKSRTPVLDNFSRDITKLAEEGKLDPVVGRGKEKNSLSQTLSLRKKNTPILIGERGTGKTSIIAGLAIDIMQRKINRTLFDKRIVELDITALMGSSEKNGVYEERIKAIFNELERNRDVVLVIDDITAFIDVNKNIKNFDGIGFLKKALERGELICIATSTPNSYQYFVENYSTLDRFFQKIYIEQSTIEETTDILFTIKSKYEEFHNVLYSQDAIEACAKLSKQYIKERFFPDKAIDIMDEVGSITHINNIKVPKIIEDLEKEIEILKERKNYSVKNQMYEEAANLRDSESRKIRELEFAKVEWEEEVKSLRFPVTEEDVFNMFSSKTGLSIDKIRELYKNDFELSFAEDENSNYEYIHYKEKFEEYDLGNKASIKLDGIPNALKTCFQQYILFFKDYLEKVKGKSIYFEVTKIEEGLRIDINPKEVDDFEQINYWFNEYLHLIGQKDEKIDLVFEKEVDANEASLINEEIVNQIKFLESQMNVIQKQVDNLAYKENVVKELGISLSDDQRYLIEQGFSDFETFKFSLKQTVGAGKSNEVLEILFKYINQNPEKRHAYIDEIILLNSRSSELNLRVRTGVIAYDMENIERQKINQSIVEFINNLK